MATLFIYLPAFSVYYLRNSGIIDITGQFNVIQLTFFVDFLFAPFIVGAMLRISRDENLRLNTSFVQKKIEAEKLQELDTVKTQFFTNISHEFRTPLTLILGPIEDLKRKNPTNSIYQIIHRNATRLLELINQLLDLNKLESGQMTVELKKRRILIRRFNDGHTFIFLLIPTLQLRLVVFLWLYLLCFWLCVF